MLGLAVLLVAMGSAALALIHAEQSFRGLVGSTREAFAQLGANQVATAVASAAAGVRAVANQPSMARMLREGDAEGARAMFEQVQRNALFIDALWLLDDAGVVVAGYPETVRNPAVIAASAQLSHGTPRVVRLGARLELALREPLPTGGSVIGALSLVRMMERIQQVRFGATGAVTVVTDAGEVLASSDPARRDRNLTAPELLASIGAQRVAVVEYLGRIVQRPEISAVAPVPGLPLTVIVSQSQQEVFGPLRGLRLTLAWIAALLFAAALGLIALGMHVARRQQELLARSESRYRDLVDMSMGLICEHDPEGRLLTVNPAAARSLGYEREEMEGRNLACFIAARHQPQLHAYLERMRRAGEDEGTMALVTRSGETRIWQYHNRLYHSGHERAPYVIGHAQDVTERRAYEAQLREQSRRDALTGVRNRRFLAEFERGAAAGARWGCVVIDIDHFKQINDRYGHRRGDEVLVAIARLLTLHARQSDEVVRMGGDEFLVLIPDAQAGAVEALAERLTVQGRQDAPCGFSIGAALREGEEALDRTIDRADQQLYSVRVAERARERRGKAVET